MRHGSETNASRELQYSPASGRDVPLETSIDSFPGLVPGRDARASQSVDHHGPESQELSPSDMIAPVSVVHSMSVNLLGSNSVRAPVLRLVLRTAKFYADLHGESGRGGSEKGHHRSRYH